MESAPTIWTTAQLALQKKLDRDSYERYLAGVNALAFDESKDVFTLGVLNDFSGLWLESNYKDVLEEVLRDVLGRRITIKFEVDGRLEDVAAGAATGSIIDGVGGEPENGDAAAEPVPRCRYRPDFTFDTFVVGSSNRIPYAAAQAVCKNPGKAYNPMFIYGGVGLGKTHLLQAIANEVAARRKRAKIEFLTSEEFVNLYVEAIQTKTLPSFRRHFRSLEILLIDDVQFFEGKVGSSEEFFHTFNTLHNAHKQIILASDRTPQEISGLEQRLVSRFDCGLSAETLPPDLEMRVAILKKKQETQTIKFPDEILFLIANRITSNIRTLESALTRLIMNVSAFGSELNLEMAEELLRDKFENETAKPLSVDAIQRRVAEYHDIRFADMTSKKRPQNIAVPRMVAMYIARKLTDMSLPAIGDSFNRNHATIIHAVATIDKRMAADENFRHNVNVLMRQLRS